MIKFKLICKDCETTFDSWFSSSKEYEKLRKKKFLNCHFCNSLNVGKGLMSPSVSMSKNSLRDIDSSSKKYRENQDYLAKFVADKIRKSVPDPNNPEKQSKISKSVIQKEFKEWWSREYDTKAPKGKELIEYLEKKLGPYPGTGQGRGWAGYEIIYDEYDDED